VRPTVVTVMDIIGQSGGAPTSSAGGAHCFLRGTLIPTPSREREISTLQNGELVTWQSGRDALLQESLCSFLSQVALRSNCRRVDLV
jgi:hypothetical protein